MKKLVTILLIVTLLLSLLGGCSEYILEDLQSGENTEAENPEDSEIASGIKMGFIFLHTETSTYDLNFLNAAKAACKEYGVTYELRTSVPEGEGCYTTACELAEAGCDIIFADSFGHEPYLIEAAKKYPDVEFCHATGTRAHTEGLDNYHNAFATIYEGRYLAGVAAGLKVNEMIANGEITEQQAKLGYIGAFTYAEVISGYTAFYLGAKSVCPSVTMEVTFTGSWYDEEAEKKGAQKLISRDCVLISQHADSIGAPAVCEKAGVPNICYNGSNLSACPDTFVVASYINWAPYFAHVIQCVANHTAIEADWVGDISTDSVKLTPIGQNAAKGTVEQLEKVKSSLEAGQLQVFDVKNFTVKGKKLKSYQADVNTDAKYTPDTEVIADGVYQESAFRSAPYFDVRIDGIKLLDEAY